MSRILFTRELTQLGYGSGEVRRLVQTGQLIQIRRGAYVAGADSVSLTERAEHRRLIEATLDGCSPDAVVSRMSAAVLHNLPIWSGLARVQLTRSRAGGSKLSKFVELRGLPLADEDVVVINGITVTSLARTVVDLACQLPMDQSVAVGDAALRFGLDPSTLLDLLERSRGRHGIGAARRAVAFLDARSESPGESRSRVVLHQHGAPTPELQYEVFDTDGVFVARTDFAWPEFRTVGEFDGQVKYRRELRSGHDPEQELFDEKRREDAVRDLDLQVVRWISADLQPATALVARLYRAFARGRRAA